MMEISNFIRFFKKFVVLKKTKKINIFVLRGLQTALNLSCARTQVLVECLWCGSGPAQVPFLG